MIEKSEYFQLVQEANKLKVECEFGQSTLIAAAVICLERIADRLEEIMVVLESLNAEFEKHDEPKEGVGYGGVVRSHHDGD